MLAKTVCSNRHTRTQSTAKHATQSGPITHWVQVLDRNTHTEKHGRLEDHDDTTNKRRTHNGRNSMQMV